MINKKLKDFFLVNSLTIKSWLNEHLEECKEKTISLDDIDIAGRTNAIIEARLFKKLISEINILIGNEERTQSDDNI